MNTVGSDDRTQAPSISVFFPCFNEQDNIRRSIERAAEALRRFCSDFELIVVNDGSTDNTGRLADELAAEHSYVRVVHHSRNRKLGGALKTGFGAAVKDLVFYTDGDNPIDFNDLPKAVSLLENADVVSGYRTNRDEGRLRAVYSAVYNRLVRFLFGLRVRDINFSFKLFRRKVIDSMVVESEGSFVDVEMLCKSRDNGFRIVQIGVKYYPRTAGVSTLARPTVILKILMEMLPFWIRRFCGRIGVRRRRHAFKGEGDWNALLVVNADDFGLSPHIDEGIIKSFRSGIVTAAGLVACGRAFDNAVRLARENPGLDVGCHLTTVGETPLSSAGEIPSLVSATGSFHGSWGLFVLNYLRGKISVQDVEREWRRQIQRIVDAGIRPTHISSHQHIHMLPELFEVACRLAAEYSIKSVRIASEPACVRSFSMNASDRVKSMFRWFVLNLLAARARRCVARYGLFSPRACLGLSCSGRLDPSAFRSLAASIQRSGVYELECHPGRACEELLAEYPWEYDWDEDTAVQIDFRSEAVLREYSIGLASFRDSVPAETGLEEASPGDDVEDTVGPDEDADSGGHGPNIDLIRIIDRHGFSMARRVIGLILRRGRDAHVPANPESILVIKFWGLGNIVRVMPAMKCLRARFPAARIVFLTLRGNGVLYGKAGVYDECIEVSLEGLISFAWSILRLLRSFRSHRHDLLVNLEPLSNFVDVFASLCGAGHICGFVNRRMDVFFDTSVVFNQQAHITTNFRRLIEGLNVECIDMSPVPVALGDNEREIVGNLLNEAGISGDRPVLGVNVNAGDVAGERKWPPERFVETISVVVDKRYVDIVFVGSPAERAYVDSVVKRLGFPAANLAGRTTIMELAALIDRFDVFLTNDTGPMHIADAVGTPMVALFGPESPDVYGPMGSGHRVIYSGLPCSPCLTFANGKRIQCEGVAKCMTAITVFEVVTAVESLLPD